MFPFSYKHGPAIEAQRDRPQGVGPLLHGDAAFHREHDLFPKRLQHAVEGEREEQREHAQIDLHDRVGPFAGA